MRKEACTNTHEHGRRQDAQAEQVGHWGLRGQEIEEGEKKRARERRERQLSL